MLYMNTRKVGRAKDFDRVLVVVDEEEVRSVGDKGLSGNENRFSFHLHLHLMADKFGHTPNWARTMALLLAQPTFRCYISYV